MPGERFPDPDTHCPSCGRFVGAQEMCPHCGARVPKRLGLRVVRYAAVALAVLGLIALWVAGRRAEVPVIQIGDLSGTMNWAYVRLEGIVIRYPSYDEQSGYLQFWISDGTGEIAVTAYRNESRALIQSGRVPAIGDRVAVEGTLKVREDSRTLTCDVPERVVVERSEWIEMPIGAIADDHIYQKVRVEGQVRAVRSPYPGLTVLSIRDGTGQVSVTYDEALVRLTGDPAEVIPGDFVEVRGSVTLYRGSPQIALDAADGLRSLPEGSVTIAQRPIVEIGADDVGRMVRVDGVVADVKQMSAGRRYVLKDGTGTIALVLWQDLLDRVANRAGLREGARLDVQGIVAIYGGDLELIPELPLDVRIAQTQPVLPTRLPLSEITVERDGETVTTEGQIVRGSPFSNGVRFTLQDGEAVLLVVLWQELFDAHLGKGDLVPGAWVSVQGKVQVYRGELEIVPGHPDDIVFLEMREPPKVERREIGDLSEEDLGQYYEIEGQIVAVNPFAKGVRWRVEDGTGTIIVLVWENVLALLSTSFDVGTRVAATGQITVYGGMLEIAPPSADDLRWLGSVVTPTPTPISTVPSTPTPTPISTQPSTPTPTATPSVVTLSTGNVKAAQIGQEVTIEGRIIEANSFSSGVRFYVDDGSGRLVLWMFQDVYARLPNVAGWIVGSTVRATGMVQEYRGEIEVVPRVIHSPVLLVVATPMPETITRVGELTTADIGRRVTAEGKIVEVRSFSKGIRCLLDDGSGRVVLLLWQNVYDAVPHREQLAVGATVRVAGMVDEYQGELEIAPSMGSEVEVK